MSEKTTVLIIDDEPLARSVLKEYLQEFDELEVIGECGNGFEGIKAVHELRPGLVFLDIQMPKLTGFEMLELLEEKPPIIFVTAYDEFALKAFEVNAVDYLLKPVSKNRLKGAVSKALAAESPARQQEKTEKLKEYVDSEKGHVQRVVSRDGSKIHVINVKNIKRIEAQDDYVMIYAADEKHLKKETMKYFENHLNPEEFIRIHRSHIINIKAIEQIELYEKDSYRAILKDGAKLPVSRSGYARLKELLGL